MADELQNAQTADSGAPVFQIQRMYLKDLSLEQPNAPQILLEQQQPQVDINLTLSAENVTDGIYEVCVTATVNTKVGDKTLFPGSTLARGSPRTGWRCARPGRAGRPRAVRSAYPRSALRPTR